MSLAVQSSGDPGERRWHPWRRVLLEQEWQTRNNLGVTLRENWPKRNEVEHHPKLLWAHLQWYSRKVTHILESRLHSSWQIDLALRSAEFSCFISLTSSQLPFLSGRKTKPSTWPPKPVCSVTSYCFTFLPSLILLAKESSQESFFRWTLSHALFPGVNEAFGCTRKLSPPLLSAGRCFCPDCRPGKVF